VRKSGQLSASRLERERSAGIINRGAWSTGTLWDMLPHDLLPKSTSVYDYFVPWRDVGTMTKFVDALRVEAPNTLNRG